VLAKPIPELIEQALGFGALVVDVCGHHGITPEIQCSPTLYLPLGHVVSGSPRWSAYDVATWLGTHHPALLPHPLKVGIVMCQEKNLGAASARILTEDFSIC
jgi:hypothetical protein